MLDERKLDVLRAIVADFVTTHEPVGSRSLTERHSLGVSPATIRNDMAALEDDGYITQPHTSAGRVPTDKGYRLFVDRLSTVKPLTAAERKAIESFLGGAVDLDDVVHRSVRLLSQLTRQVAVVQYPTLTRSSVRHVELVQLGEARVLVVLITDTGRVEQRVVELGEAVNPDDIADLRGRLVTRVGGRRLVDAPGLLDGWVGELPTTLQGIGTVLTTALLESLVARPEERVAVGGTANLARTVPWDFPQSIRPVLEALEEQVVLLKLLGEAQEADQVYVRIGEENSVEGLRSTSVVSVGYSASDGEQPLGALGVVGPTRMDYAVSMAAVQAVARYVGHALAGGV